MLFEDRATSWGIIDVVSCSTGEMDKRYGFIHVDKDNHGNGTLKRTKKDSFYWYQKVSGIGGLLNTVLIPRAKS